MFFFSPRPAPGRLIPNIEMGGTGVGAAGRMVYSLEYDSRYFLPGMDPYRAEQKVIRQVSTISGWGVAGFVSWEGGEEREGWGTAHAMQFNAMQFTEELGIVNRN